MIFASDIADLGQGLASLNAHAQKIAFVPTMGNLHAGHLALVKQAHHHADAVVASIFVNPMQFAAHEDLSNYPRTLEADLTALETAGVDLVFTPRDGEIYPEGSASHTAIHVPSLGDALCGKDRPGHFDGVCTVVYKLFQLVKPDVAVFGEKDLQQLLIIKKMVSDLGLPIEIRSGATQRAEDGLALSSRNHYLSAAERAIAPKLFSTLTACAESLPSAAQNSIETILASSRGELESAGSALDYFELRGLPLLQRVSDAAQDCALFVAARLGQTRLIDNIQLLNR